MNTELEQKLRLRTINQSDYQTDELLIRALLWNNDESKQSLIQTSASYFLWQFTFLTVDQLLYHATYGSVNLTVDLAVEDVGVYHGNAGEFKTVYNGLWIIFLFCFCFVSYIFVYFFTLLFSFSFLFYRCCLMKHM